MESSFIVLFFFSWPKAIIELISFRPVLLTALIREAGLFAFINLPNPHPRTVGEKLPSFAERLISSEAPNYANPPPLIGPIERNCFECGYLFLPCTGDVGAYQTKQFNAFFFLSSMLSFSS